MEESCVRISGYAAQCLRKAGTYHILSQFDHVINLADGLNVLSIQDGWIPFTPLSIVLGDDVFRTVSVGLSESAVFHTDGGCLRTAGMTLDARPITPCSLRVRTGERMLPRTEAKQWLRMAVNVLAKPGSLLYAAWPMLAEWSGDELDAMQLRALDLIRRGEPDALVGLGGGLTPAGDDFLVGLLAVLQVCGAREAFDTLLAKLRGRLQETPVLSRAFLQRALEGEFSKPVLELFTALEQGGQKEITKAASRLCAIGHTSGCDLLGGIVYGFDQIETEEGIP